MAKEFSKSFYSSAAWQKARHAYIMYRIAIDGGLCEIWDEVVGHAIGQLADFGRRMCAHRVEIAKQDALDIDTGMDIVGDDFLTHLLGVAVGRCGRLDWGLFGYRILVRLAIHCARR